MRPRRRGVVRADDAVSRVFPLVARIHPHAVFAPTEFPVLVDHDFVISPFLSAQIPHLHALQPLPRALLHRHILPFPLVQPEEEILIRWRLFPRLVVFPQIAAVPVLHVYHLEEIRDIHLLRTLDPVLLLREAFLAEGIAVRG